MDNVSDVRLETLEKSQYMKPMRMYYKQDNKAKTWDLVLCHDCVYIVLFNTSRGGHLVFVRQFRPVVYFGAVRRAAPAGTILPGEAVDTSGVPASAGITTELCAGIVDKAGMSYKEIAKEEILEECGYEVPLDKIEQVQTNLVSVGVTGERMTLFYAEVSDEMKKEGAGGGVASEGELIETAEMTPEEARAFVDSPDVVTTPPTLNGIRWFLMHKWGQKKD